jgi:glycosyltransferase involved in cell wall biosynthesis
VTAVKRDTAALANAFKALDKDYDAYLQRVSRFKEKLKWDIVAEQHVSIYRRKCKNTSTITTVS